MSENSSGLQSKPRYEILDGLRGVAALMVVAFHILEAHSTTPLDHIINHGYLAVDFFSCFPGLSSVTRMMIAGAGWACEDFLRAVLFDCIRWS